jgi:hypothetical protein
MQKPLDPNSHAVLDYALGIGCLTIPVVAGFNRVSSLATYGIGIAQLGLSLFTKYPASIVKAIPFKVHGAIELSTALGMLAAPMIPKMLDMKAKTFFFSSGISLLAIYMLTDYSQQAVDVAQIEFDEMAEKAKAEVNDLVDQFEEQIPEPVMDIVRKAS